MRHRLLFVFLPALLLSGCVSGRPPAKVFPDQIASGAWNLGPEPTEDQLDHHGYHGMRVWELSRDSFSALFAPEAYAWAITDGDQYPIRRPEPLPLGVRPTDAIGSFLVGVESSWYEREIRQRQSKAGYRLALFMRRRYAFLNNVDGGWGN